MPRLIVKATFISKEHQAILKLTKRKRGINKNKKKRNQANKYALKTLNTRLAKIQK